MTTAPLPANEGERLRAVRDLGQLDTAPDPVMDAVTRLAASICDVPIALISLVDENRQWFKSSVGFGAKETPRELAFCAHAILSPAELMEVQDATKDPRFCDNPLVTDDPYIRFYAGVPLMTHGGLGLGTLCAIDRAPRALTPLQKEQLRDLATVVVHILNTTRTADSLAHVSLALKRAEHQFRLLFENAPTGMALVGMDGRYLRANRQFYKLVDYDESELLKLTFAGLTHPDDRGEDSKLTRELVSGSKQHARRRKRYVRRGGEPVHVDVHVSLMRDDAGAPIGFISQVIDITAELAADARLRESEALLSSLLESVPDSIMSVDREGRLTKFNSHVANDVYRTYGVTVERGMSLFDLGDEQTRSAAIANHNRCLSGESLRFEWSAQRIDGKSLHLLMSHTPMVLGSEIFGAAIMVKDITDRREMELAIVLKNLEIELQRSIATTANEALTSDEAIAHILELVAKFGGWVAGHAFALAAGELVSKKLWYLQDPTKLARFRAESEQLRFREGIGLPGRVLATKHPAWMASLADHPAFLRANLARESNLVSGFAFPVFVGDEVVSVIEFFSEREEHPTDELGRLLENVGRQVGRVIERERHAAEVRALSLTDELTGLYNRRGFMTLARQQLRVASRSTSASALLSADLDGLKRINDESGHDAGDEVIASFASVLRRTFRGEDIVARLGGDEFVVLMSTSIDNTRSALSRLSQAIEAQNASRPRSAALSASIGVLAVPSDTVDSLDVILARADLLMYENKRSRHACK